ncbi:COATOMER [Salix viminalis]|uniref:COATOMER n=1 Tax=Salix viminalis TaxID=40686 RepID=A0A9Q0TP55_SALVM|nr:COATOMER [Salix viminalis]
MVSLNRSNFLSREGSPPIYAAAPSFSSLSVLHLSKHISLQAIYCRLLTCFNCEMALTLKTEQEFTQSSERVKSLDLHPTQPWILTGLYSGAVCIWNYHTQTMEKSFKVTESPVRSAKFIARKHWIVTGSDDKFIRVYNYETAELVKELENTLDYGLGRVWAVGCKQGSSQVAFGCDNGTTMLKVVLADARPTSNS